MNAWHGDPALKERMNELAEAVADAYVAANDAQDDDGDHCYHHACDDDRDACAAGDCADDDDCVHCDCCCTCLGCEYAEAER